MTRGQLITKVARKLSMKTTSSHEDRLFLEGVANEAVEDVLKRAKLYVDIGNMALTAGETHYRLNVNILAVLEAEIIGGLKEVVAVPMAEIKQRLRSAGYQDQPYAISGYGNLVIFYPPPAAGATARLTYVPKPSAMTDDAHDPSVVTYGGIPAQYHRAIEYYMLWQAAEYTGAEPPYDSTYYLKLYERELVNERHHNRNLLGRRRARPRIGYPGSPYPKRNDVYP